MLGKIFKKFVSIVSIVLLIIFIIYSIHIINLGNHCIDLSAEVISIKTDDDERCLYVITSHTYTGTDNIICEIKIPYRTRCKSHNTGDKISVQDIKIGDIVSLNFKGESEYIDGVNYAVAKGIIDVLQKEVLQR